MDKERPNKGIVNNRYAWWYKNYARNDKDLESAEQDLYI